MTIERPGGGTEDHAFVVMAGLGLDARMIANTRPEPQAARVFAAVPGLYDALPLLDLLGGADPVKMSAGAFEVKLAPYQAALYAPRDGTIDGYRFFKRR